MSFMTKTVVSAAPTSTTNMTGFLARTRGFSFTNDCLIARFKISGSNKGRVRTPFEMSWALPSAFGAGVSGCCGGAVTLAISKHLSVQHLEMLDDRTQRKSREISQCTNNHNGSNQQNHEQ